MQLAEDFSSDEFRVVLNGGIDSFTKVLQHRNNKNLAGVMAGRWLLRRPFDLLKVQCLLESPLNKSSNPLNQFSAISTYAKYASETLSMSERDEYGAIFMPFALMWLSLWREFDSIEELSEHSASDISLASQYSTCIASAWHLIEVSAPLLSEFYRIDSRDCFLQGGHNSTPEVPPFKKFWKHFERAIGKKITTKMKQNSDEVL